MESWKKAAVLASISAAGVLFMKQRHTAGVLATGVGLALLASEYPEKFEKIRRSLPDYFERSMKVMEIAGKAGKHITDASPRNAMSAWEEFGF
jgi:K+/H+ antiporter YhaU regulatory subunit KhtT